MLPDTQPQVYRNAQLSTTCPVYLFLAALHLAQLRGYLLSIPPLSISLWKANREKKEKTILIAGFVLCLFVCFGSFLLSPFGQHNSFSICHGWNIRCVRTIGLQQVALLGEAVKASGQWPN